MNLTLMAAGGDLAFCHRYDTFVTSDGQHFYSVELWTHLETSHGNTARYQPPQGSGLPPAAQRPRADASGSRRRDP